MPPDIAPDPPLWTPPKTTVAEEIAMEGHKPVSSVPPKGIPKPQSVRESVRDIQRRAREGTLTEDEEFYALMMILDSVRNESGER